VIDDRLDDDRLHEECGVFGIHSPDGAVPVAETTFYGLYALQHRGQEAAGIAVHDATAKRILAHRGMSLVSRVFDEAALAKLAGGRVAIGHVRYATHGSSSPENTQPVVVKFARGELAVAHNGNLVNGTELTRELEATGSIFQTGLDTEVFAHLISRAAQGSFEDALMHALSRVRGAYSLAMLFNDTLYALRDPNGFRPLVLGTLKGATVVASETCALDLIGAEYVRDVKPGEVLRIDRSGIASFQLPPAPKVTPCVFELVYFARPDSTVFGQHVHEARTRMGMALAREAPASADIVVPVPDSGVAAALGYATESGVPYAVGLTRNHYIGRTFIQPGQDARELKLKVKLNPMKPVLAGKRIVLVDDSIVRGTTMKLLVRMIRAAGAKEVHLRISSPPIRHPCFFGVDTPYYDQLIAANKSQGEIRTYLGVDSLEYLSLDGLAWAVGREKSFCRACFDGNYAVEVPSREEIESGAEGGVGCGAPEDNSGLRMSPSRSDRAQARTRPQGA
jgi:amidophosphoribosyltransferase